eukprot:Nitzschia sp. Nitz4//scaffold212_size37733//3118//4464//NITZ4_007729-RA/size37733-processed-gene-0.41-mRNA-1//-1//CDS//3329542010//4538//frame0
MLRSTILVASVTVLISSVSGFLLPWGYVGRSTRLAPLHGKPPLYTDKEVKTLNKLATSFERQIGRDNKPKKKSKKLKSEDLEGVVEEYVVPPELEGQRLDSVLATIQPKISRMTWGKWIREGRVLHQQGKAIKQKSHKVQQGSTIQAIIPNQEAPFVIKPENIPLDVLYEDDHMIVVNKVAGMVVHPAAGNWDGTLVNALAHYLPTSAFGVGDYLDDDFRKIPMKDPTGADGETLSCRPGIVHRLDKGTSGVIVVAKTSRALSVLSEAFANRDVKKTYLAITVGNPGEGVVIDKRIGRHPTNRQRMRVVPNPHHTVSSNVVLASGQNLEGEKGKRAISTVRTLASDGKLSFVEVSIQTGRTHQIRVHLEDRKTPVYGDEVYGVASWNRHLKATHGVERPLLHAYRLELNHPVTGDHMEFVAPLQDDMKMVSNVIWPEGKDQLPGAFRN